MKDNKLELAEVKKVAVEIITDLNPFCERIAIAGSIRRNRPLVSDIELVVIPKYEIVPSGFFDTIDTCLLTQHLMRSAKYQMRLNKNGYRIFGEKNKLMLYKGVPVDIFTATEDNWVMLYFIRTGGAATNQRIARRAIQVNKALKIYEGGFLDNATGDIYRVRSEEEIYDILGLAYEEPHSRA